MGSEWRNNMKKKIMRLKKERDVWDTLRVAAATILGINHPPYDTIDQGFKGFQYKKENSQLRGEKKGGRLNTEIIHLSFHIFSRFSYSCTIPLEISKTNCQDVRYASVSSGQPTLGLSNGVQQLVNRRQRPPFKYSKRGIRESSFFKKSRSSPFKLGEGSSDDFLVSCLKKKE